MAMNVALSKESMATMVADWTLILLSGIGLFGLDFKSIETSAISLKVLPAAMKHIAEVV